MIKQNDKHNILKIQKVNNCFFHANNFYNYNLQFTIFYNLQFFFIHGLIRGKGNRSDIADGYRWHQQIIVVLHVVMCFAKGVWGCKPQENYKILVS